ncbi:MAG: lysophospholipid acyltransferase family protein [Saprospiraceae bacterium]
MIIKYFIAFLRLLIFAVSLIISFSFYFIFLRPFAKDKNRSGFRYRHYYLTFINFFLGVREQVTGKPEIEPALYVCNHRGMVDFFVNLKYIDAFILSKADVAKIPILGYFAQFTGIFYIERSNMESRLATRDAIKKILMSGYNVILYPEGTTNIGRLTKSFSRGSFEVTVKNGFPVVPMALEYQSGDDLWKNTGLMTQFVKQFGKLTTNVKMSFGNPIVTDDYNIAMSEAKSWIDNELTSMQKNWSKAYDAD